MKKLIISLISVLMIFTHACSIANATEEKTLESIELTAGKDFCISYNADTRSISFYDYGIVERYSDGTTNVLSNYRRHQIVYSDGHAIVKITSIDKTYSFKITFIINREGMKKATVFSIPESTCIAKYICSSGKQTLTAESLACKLEYSDSQADVTGMSIDGNTAVSESSAFYMTLDNALIYKNNYSDIDNSNFLIDTFPDGEVPSAPENTPIQEKYAFKGWYSDKKCVSPYDFSIPVNESTVIYAGWKYNMRNLTVINGTQSGEYTVGSEITVNADKIKGKSFLFWRSDTPDFDLNSKYRQSSSFIMPDFDLTITAVYTNCFHTNIKFTADDEFTHSGVCSCGELIVANHEFILHQVGNKAFLVCTECGYMQEKQSDNTDLSDGDESRNNETNGDENETKETDGDSKPHNIATPTDCEIIIPVTDRPTDDNNDSADAEQIRAITVNTGDSRQELYIYFLLFGMSTSVILISALKSVNKHRRKASTYSD